MSQKPEILPDEEIKRALIDAEKQVWEHRAHPVYEKEKYLLQAQHDYMIKLGFISREQHEREMREQAEAIAKALALLPRYGFQHGHGVYVKDQQLERTLAKYLTPRSNTCATCGKPIEPGQDFVNDPLRHAGAECANKRKE